MASPFALLNGLNSGDLSFGLIAIEKELRTVPQMTLIFRALLKVRAEGSIIAVEHFVEDRGVFEAEELDRIIRTRWKHARACGRCDRRTFLLPMQRSKDVPCEHCGSVLCGGRLERPRSRPLPTRTRLVEEIDTGPSLDPAKASTKTRSTVKEKDDTTKWDNGFDKLYDQIDDFNEPPKEQKEFGTVMLVPSNGLHSSESSFVVIDESKSDYEILDWEEQLIGEKLGRYEVTRKINEGGMSVLFLAHNDLLDQDFVIKVLKQEHVNERRIKRMILEARSCMRLSHPNIVRVFSVDRTDEGLYYMVMEYVEGLDLQNTLEKLGAFAWAEALKIISQVALGLSIAHQNKIVHRDIKPANILLSRDGGIKLVDFGLAKNSESSSSLTKEGMLIGTPLYMVPEMGIADEMDHRADIYGLGLTLYYMLVGAHPFEDASLMDLLKKQAHKNIEKPDHKALGCPEALIAILGNMLEFNREERYQSVEELLTDLGALIKGKEPSVPDMGYWAEAPRSKRKDDSVKVEHFSTFNVFMNFLKGKTKPKA
jgi:serine/threonine protein kinase